MQSVRKIFRDYEICSLKISRDKAIGMLIGSSFLVIIPLIHIGFINLYLWVPDKKKVDRKRCRCSCFDTVFKGIYEYQDVIRYKHVYFNATHQTLKIWTLTIFYAVLFYESVRYLVNTHCKGTLRWPMAMLFVCGIYPHYYSWWGYFGYYNEDFYAQVYHQLFFSVTELISSSIVLHLCAGTNRVTLLKISVIVCIAVVHILVSFVDQFFVHVLIVRGEIFQICRDIGLFLPDMLHVIVPVIVWKRNRKQSDFDYLKIFANRNGQSYIETPLSNYH